MNERELELATQALSLVDAIRARIDPLGGVDLDIAPREPTRVARIPGRVDPAAILHRAVSTATRDSLLAVDWGNPSGGDASFA